MTDNNEGQESLKDVIQICAYIHENFDIKFACDDCTVTVRLKDRQVTSARDHRLVAGVCNEDVLLLKKMSDRSSSFKTTKNNNWYSKIRDLSHMYKNYDAKMIEICHLLLKNRACDKEDACSSAHNREEQKIWTYLMPLIMNGLEFGDFINHLKGKEGKSVNVSPARTNGSNSTEFKSLDEDYSTNDHFPEELEDKIYVPNNRETLSDNLSTLSTNDFDADNDDNKSEDMNNNSTPKPNNEIGSNDSSNMRDEDILSEEYDLSVDDLECVVSKKHKKKIVDLDRLVPLTSTHDLYPACRRCFDPSRGRVTIFDNHDCPRDQILARDKSEWGRGGWQIVRPHGASSHRSAVQRAAGVARLELCRSSKSHCPQGVFCTYAHSKIELEIWTREAQTDRTLLPENLAATLRRCILPCDQALLRDSFKKIGRFGLWFGCQKCVLPIDSGYCAIMAFLHDCDQNLAAVRCPPSTSNSFWRVVRPRKMQSGSENVQLCQWITRSGGCWFGKPCNYCHSEVEMQFWSSDLRNELDIEQFLISERKIWRRDVRKTFYQQSTNENAPFSIESPPASVAHAPILVPNPALFTKISNPSNLIGQKSTNQIDVCPYPVRYICRTCYVDRKIVSYRLDNMENLCDKGQHDWRRNRFIAAIRCQSTSGKEEGFPLRNLPYTLINKQRPVLICNNVKVGGSCLRQDCFFAHFKIEQEIWTYLMYNKPGKDIDSLAIEFKNPRPSVRFVNNNPSAPKLPAWVPSSIHVESERPLTLYCFLCDLMFENELVYNSHRCQLMHEILTKTDAKNRWLHRAPLTSRPFSYCERHINQNSCNYSFSRENLCPYAHSFEELVEWNRRMDLIESEKRTFFPN